MGQIFVADELVFDMSEIAKAHGLTVDEQAADWLREALRRHAAARNLKAMFTEISVMSRGGAAPTDSVDLLREVRDR